MLTSAQRSGGPRVPRVALVRAPARGSHVGGSKAAMPARRGDDVLSGLLQRCVSGRCGCAGKCDEKPPKDPEARRGGEPTPDAGDALGALLQRAVAVRAPHAMVARLSESDCAPKDKAGLRPDKKSYGNPTKWKLTIAVDREAKSRWGYIAGDVGHTWVKLSHDRGELWSFGMWPQQYFNPVKPGSPVKGCIHHPDQAHEPPNAVEYKEISYDINEKQYEDALNFAMDECERRPDYNLLYYNCTHFAVETARQARVKPPSNETMSVPNPNAIFEGIEEEEELAEEQEDVKGRARAAAFIEEQVELPNQVRWRGNALARPNPNP